MPPPPLVPSCLLRHLWKKSCPNFSTVPNSIRVTSRGQHEWKLSLPHSGLPGLLRVPSKPRLSLSRSLPPSAALARRTKMPGMRRFSSFLFALLPFPSQGGRPVLPKLLGFFRLPPYTESGGPPQYPWCVHVWCVCERMRLRDSMNCVIEMAGFFTLSSLLLLSATFQSKPREMRGGFLHQRISGKGFLTSFALRLSHFHALELTSRSQHILKLLVEFRCEGGDRNLGWQEMCITKPHANAIVFWLQVWFLGGDVQRKAVANHQCSCLPQNPRSTKSWVRVEGTLLLLEASSEILRTRVDLIEITSQ